MEVNSYAYCQASTCSHVRANFSTPLAKLQLLFFSATSKFANFILVQAHLPLRYTFLDRDFVSSSLLGLTWVQDVLASGFVYTQLAQCLIDGLLQV